jgi:toxin CptA
MPTSTRSSSTSVPCRLEWRPSRWATGALILLAALAPFCVVQSEMPRALAWPLAVLACAWGLRDALREWSQPARLFVFGPGLAGVSLDGRPLVSAMLRWRGPLAFLHWRDAGGQGGRLVWWPDTLPAAERRRLKVNAALIRPLRGHLLPRAGEGAAVAP